MDNDFVSTHLGNLEATITVGDWKVSITGTVNNLVKKEDRKPIILSSKGDVYDSYHSIELKAFDPKVKAYRWRWEIPLKNKARIEE